MSGSGRALIVAPVIAIAIAALIPAMGFTSPPAADAIWSTKLCVKEGVSDFGNRTLGDLFRDARFQQVLTGDGVKVTFGLQTKSVTANEAVVDFVMYRNGAESERFSFWFRTKGAYAILYKLTSDRGTVEGPDELLLAMKRFYLPTLLED